MNKCNHVLVLMSIKPDMGMLQVVCQICNFLVQVEAMTLPCMQDFSLYGEELKQRVKEESEAAAEIAARESCLSNRS